MMEKKEQFGFRVPEGYFKSLPDRLEQRLKLEKQPGSGQQSANPNTDEPYAEASTTETGFRVPEAYFDTFGERLQQRLDAPSSRVFRLNPRWAAWAVGVAAAAVVALLVWPASVSPAIEFSDLADAEIENYLEVGYEDASAYELAESLPAEDLEMNDLIDTRPAEGQLLDFLDNNPEVLEELILDEDE